MRKGGGPKFFSEALSPAETVAPRLNNKPREISMLQTIPETFHVVNARSVVSSCPGKRPHLGCHPGRRHADLRYVGVNGAKIETKDGGRLKGGLPCSTASLTR